MIIITSCWSAPGSNRRPPTISFETAVCSRFRLALMCLSRRQPHSHTNSVPFRESCNLPHTGHFLLLFLGSTKWTVTPLHLALYSMNWWSFLLGHMLKRLLRRLSSLGLKTPLRSSSTIAAVFSSAKSSTALATWCILYSTRSCSLFPSLLQSRLEVRRSWDFFFWRRFRRSWCLCCIMATCGKEAFTGTPFPSPTNTPSRLLSFVSRETTDSGTNGRGSVFLKAITTLSGKSVREPREKEGSSRNPL